MSSHIKQHERYFIVRSILLLALVSSASVAAINLVLGKYALACFDLGIAVLCVVSLLGIKNIQTLQTLHRVSIGLACLLLGLLLYSFTIDPPLSIFIWVLMIPLVAYHLTGLRFGFWITALYLLAATVIFHVYSGISIAAVPVDQLTNWVFCILLIWILTHLYERSNDHSKQQLLHIASQDTLTGLLNRSTLEQVFERYRADGVGLIILDIDDFKRINDSFGHSVGDAVLVNVANTIKNTLRDTDAVFRLGGEEFGVLLPNVTGEKTKLIAEKLINAIAQYEFELPADQASSSKQAASNNTRSVINITASGGVAACPEHGDSLTDIMSLADTRMYQSKVQGKNQVTGAS